MAAVNGSLSRRVMLVITLCALLALVGCKEAGCTTDDRVAAIDFMTQYAKPNAMVQGALAAAAYAPDEVTDAALDAVDPIKKWEKADDLVKASESQEEAGQYVNAASNIDKAMLVRPKDWGYLSRRAGIHAEMYEIDAAKQKAEQAVRYARESGIKGAEYQANVRVASELEQAIYLTGGDSAPLHAERKALYLLAAERCRTTGDLLASIDGRVAAEWYDKARRHTAAAGVNPVVP